MPTSSTILIGIVSLFCFALFCFSLGRWQLLSRRNALVLCILLSVAIFGSLWRRDVMAMRALKSLISVPEVVDATTVPSHKEIEAVATAIQSSPITPRFITREEVQELARSVREGKKNPSAIWIIVTPLPPSALDAFYQAPEHHPGWQIVESAPGCCLLLRRQSQDMLIGYSSNPAGKGSRIVYSLSSSEH